MKFCTDKIRRERRWLMETEKPCVHAIFDLTGEAVAILRPFSSSICYQHTMMAHVARSQVNGGADGCPGGFALRNRRNAEARDSVRLPRVEVR